jgi:multiple sugar transport system ATP-binding protein
LHQPAVSSASAISLRRICKSFGRHGVLRNIDLDIEPGQFCVVVGPSGCGKSTILRLIAGLETITSGELFIDGERANTIPPARRGAAMVFQSYALYPHMTVYENMAFGMRLARQDKGEIERRVQEAARLLQIEPLLERLPRQLSGGQRQRVAIGRAITRKPGVFLFDEPLSNLDAALRVQMRIELARLHERLGVTTVYVTHDQIEAMTLAQRIVILNAGEVVQVGAPLEVYHHPRTLFAARFIGSPQMNLFPGVVAQVLDGSLVVGLSNGTRVRTNVQGSAARPGDSVTLGIRPEHVQFTSEGLGLHAPVQLVEDLGDLSIVYIERETMDGLLIAKQHATRVRKGDVVAYEFPADRCHVFDRSGSAYCRPKTREAGSMELWR